MIVTPTAPPPPRRRIAGLLLVTAALLVAVAIGLAPRGPKGNFVDSSEFQLAMDSAPSGTRRPLPGGLRVSPVGSFGRDGAGWCRGFALSGAIEGGGIVCRAQDGWALTQRVAGDAALRRAMAADSATGILGAPRERALIAGGWATPAGAE